MADLRLREASTHRWFCRYDQALAAAEEGIRLSRAARDRALEMMCRREVALTLREMGDYVRAKAALEHTGRLAEALHMVSFQVHVLSNLSTLYLDQGQYGEAMGMALCDQAELPLERRLPLGDMGATAVATGDDRAARSWLLESLEIARKTADRTQEIFCLGHLGWLSVRLRQLKEAMDHLRAALALAEAIDSRTEQSWLHSGLTEACRLAGNTDQAQIHAHRAMELARAYGRPYDERIVRQALATL